MTRGTVVFWNDNRCFGAVQSHDGSKYHVPERAAVRDAIRTCVLVQA
jgi:hypothetical protein